MRFFQTYFCGLLFLSITLAGCSSSTNDAKSTDGKESTGSQTTPSANEVDKKKTSSTGDCGEGKVTTTKTSVDIKLNNGQSISLKNNDAEGEDYQHYDFKGCISEMNFYKIYVGGWEWSSYLLVGMNDGKKNELVSEPVVSPDNTKLVTSMFADHYSSDENFIYIYSYKNGELVEEFKTSPKNWGPTGLKWKDNNTIIVESGIHDEASDETKKLPSKTLTFAGGKWSVK